MTHDLDHVLNHISLKKSRSRWRWIAIAALVALVVAAFAANRFEAPTGPHVARVEVEGLITGDERQLSLLRDLAKDDDVKAVIVRIDSPGGTTVGSEALHDELRAVGEKKPVVAVMDSVAASGGYIAALAADRIYARGNTITGSIGVIFSYPDVSQLLGTVGVKMEEVKSGPLKAEPSGTKPTTPEARAVLQDMVNDGFTWFKGLVAERRRMDAAQVARVSDGRVFSGRMALTEKLIDDMGTEKDAREWLAKSKSISADLETLTRRPPPPPRESRFYIPVGRALLDGLGLDWLAQTTQTQRLDGLLVLWHPDL